MAAPRSKVILVEDAFRESIIDRMPRNLRTAARKILENIENSVPPARRYQASRLVAEPQVLQKFHKKLGSSAPPANPAPAAKPAGARKLLTKKPGRKT